MTRRLCGYATGIVAVYFTVAAVVTAVTVIRAVQHRSG